jgi:hypothetical protein
MEFHETVICIGSPFNPGDPIAQALFYDSFFPAKAAYA